MLSEHCVSLVFTRIQSNGFLTNFFVCVLYIFLCAAAAEEAARNLEGTVDIDSLCKPGARMSGPP